jgi:hypothetical protein
MLKHDNCHAFRGCLCSQMKAQVQDTSGATTGVVPPFLFGFQPGRLPGANSIQSRQRGQHCVGQQQPVSKTLENLLHQAGSCCLRADPPPCSGLCMPAQQLR